MHIFNKAFRVLKKKNETKTKERPVVVLMRHVIVKALRTRSGSLFWILASPATHGRGFRLASDRCLWQTVCDEETNVGFHSALYSVILFLESIVWSRTVW